MSRNDSGESTDAFQTPSADTEDEARGELDPALPEPDLGASPELSGPVTRSGRKRKSLVPVKSSGKKKKKMNRSPDPKEDRPQPDKAGQAVPSPKTPAPPPPDLPDVRPQNAAPEPVPHCPPQQPPPQAQDLAALLTNGLGTLQNSMGGLQASMGGMEARLAGKIDSLEASVNKNKETIAVLTGIVNKNTVDLARLEAELRSNEVALDGRVADLVKAHIAGLDGPLSLDSSRPPGLSPSQVNMYWQCKRSLRLRPIVGPNLEAVVKNFLFDFLGVDLEAMGPDTGALRVRCVIEPRSKIKDEAVVEFSSAAIRDTIKGSGYTAGGPDRWHQDGGTGPPRL